LETDNFEQRIRRTLDAPAPGFSPEEAQRIAAEIFGIEATAVLMTSERDQNFFIQAPEQEFILKIANSAEDLSVIDFQNQAMETVRIKAPDLPTPRIHRTLDGRLLATVSNATATYGVRMISHFPGVPQSRRGPPSAEFRREIGHVSGAMGWPWAR
jgi:Ser/Thr protein kinase RdoA (MazF antagonist)